VAAGVLAGVVGCLSGMADQSSTDGLRELALFAGAGGGILGGKLLGWRTICAVEWEPYASCVLAARQNDGLLPPFAIWDDIQTFDGRPWRGIVDVISGGFPCQDISAANINGDGLDGERSGMWREMARVVGEVRPRFVFVENSPMLTSLGGTRVVGDLAALGYDTRWTVMGAADIGAPHQRDRFWLVAHTRYWDGWDFGTSETGQDAPSQWSADSDSIGRPGSQSSAVAHANTPGLQGSQWLGGNPTQVGEGRTGAHGSVAQRSPTGIGSPDWWDSEPGVDRVADGVAARVDRLKALGNGQVPICAAQAWRELSEPL
jgi:DNA (cytosine-5)-methyltransferase 1